MAEQRTSRGRLPREIAPSLYWLGSCIDVLDGALPLHQFISVFLIRGATRSLLVDTGNERSWPVVERQLTEILGDAPLDYIAPTHPEIAHCSNLVRLLDRYPSARVVGDVRDHRVLFPEYNDRLTPVAVGDSIDLGGGASYVMLPAPIRDLTSTRWGYEPRSKTLFVADGFAYVHPRPETEGRDEPLHVAADCGLLSSELPSPPSVESAKRITGNALAWSRHVDAGPLFDEVSRLMTMYPTAMIAPAHGNVITDPGPVMDVIREAFRLAFVGGARSS